MGGVGDFCHQLCHLAGLGGTLVGILRPSAQLIAGALLQIGACFGEAFFQGICPLGLDERVWVFSLW